MSWCNCFDNEQVDEVYRNDKTRVSHLASTAPPMTQSQPNLHLRQQKI